MEFSIPFHEAASQEGLIDIDLVTGVTGFTNIHFIKFLVESQLMQILLLIKFQSASLCNFKTFSTNYILITIKIFLDLSFSSLHLKCPGSCRV